MEPEKLKMKLEHWIEHNNSHAANVKRQAQEAGEMGFRDVETELLLAAEDMERAGSHLQRAIDNLGCS
ncbi:MAG TPA: hypothetical protein VMW20_01320 [Candidatus Nanoarchaeia archaeon]|nr:hypothetical protein [Candidatus Nanoarchaeia archaeon]